MACVSDIVEDAVGIRDSDSIKLSGGLAILVLIGVAVSKLYENDKKGASS